VNYFYVDVIPNAVMKDTRQIYQMPLWKTPGRFTKSGDERHPADLLNPVMKDTLQIY